MYVYVVMIIAMLIAIGLYYGGVFSMLGSKTTTEAEECKMPNMVKTNNGFCICDESNGYYPTFFDPYKKNEPDDENFKTNVNNTNCIKCPVGNITTSKYRNDDNVNLHICDLSGIVDPALLKLTPTYATLDDQIYTSKNWEEVQEMMARSQ